MSTTSSENKNFYWHCQVASFLIEGFPQLNAATRAHVRNAIRMATLTARGKNGIPYATKGAIQERLKAGKDWHQLGLIREHVFPVSLIYDKVLADIATNEKTSWSDVIGSLTTEDHTNWNVPEDQSTFAPKSAKIAKIVRDHTVLAWITKKEDTALRAKGFSKSMPSNCDPRDLHARYSTCGLELIEIAQPAV